MTVSAQTLLVESRRHLVQVIAHVLTIGCSCTILLMVCLLQQFSPHILISYICVLGLAFLGSITTLLFCNRLPLDRATLPLVLALIGGVALSSLLLPETTLVSVPLLSIAVLIISLSQNVYLTRVIGMLCTMLGVALAVFAPLPVINREQSIGAALPEIYGIGVATVIVVVWMVTSRLMHTSHAAIQLADQQRSETDRAIASALEQAGTLMGADHAVLIHFAPDQTVWHITHRWSSTSARLSSLLQRAVVHVAPWWLEQMLHGHMLAFSHLAQFPMSADRERAFLDRNHVHALAMTPVVVNNVTIGCLCLIADHMKITWNRANNHLLNIVAGIISQVLEHQAVQVALRESEERYRLLAENATDIIACQTTAGVTWYCSPASHTLLGIAPATLIGQPIWTHALPEDQRSVETAYQQLVQARGTVTITYRALHTDGTPRWLEATLRTVNEQQPRGIVETVAVVRDITTRQQREEQIAYFAYHDALTGLSNRRRFLIDAERLVQHARVTASALTLLYFDLDRFKFINDTMGHSTGDELLIQVAQRLRDAIHNQGVVARLGGDEFAVLLPHVDQLGAGAAGQRLLDLFVHPFNLYGKPVYITPSIGIACFPTHGVHVEELLKHADVAMYQAKRDGGRYQQYTASSDFSSSEWFMLNTELRHAIQDNGLVLYYQPIVELVSLNMLGVEALVRWPHPSHAMLLPGQFIPIAETSGLIQALDRWVIREAICQMRAWGDAAPRFVTINVSARSLHDATLPRYIAECLGASGISSGRVTIEITESAAISDAVTTLQVLRDMEALGLRIALDDFGTEYASLRHLKTLPLHVLKIDTSFVAGLGSSKSDEAIVRAVLELGRGLDMDVIAEGVTNQQQRAWLVEAGCTHAQGFGLYEPCPADAISQLGHVAFAQDVC